MSFADGRAVLMAYLEPLITPARFCTALPAKFEQTLPVARFQRIGGGGSAIVLDHPVIDIDCFDVDEVIVEQFAARIRDELVPGIVGYTHGGATVAEIEVQNFGWRPYINTSVRSAGMTAALVLHNH